MNIQALSALLAGIVTLAIGASVLLRDRSRKTYRAFAVFTFNVALYYLFTFVAWAMDSSFFQYLALWPATFIPTSSIRFFRAFLAEPAIGTPRRRPHVTYVWTALWCGLLIYAVLVRPIHHQLWFQIPFVVYVFGGLYRCVLDLYLQYRATVPRVEKARIRYLMIGGFVAITLGLSDFLPRIGVAFPTIGNVLTILYLYFLSQTLFRYRLLDLHELIGKMVVLGSLVLILTVVYGLLLVWVGGGKQQGLFILNTLVAAFVILILFEPVRTLLENAINRWLVRERHELRHRIDLLRRELMNVIDARDLVRRLLVALEESRRLTHAALYLIDVDGGGYDLVGHVGPKPLERLDVVARRALFDRMKNTPVVLEALEREKLQLEAARRETPSKEAEVLDAAIRTLHEMNASLAIPVSGGDASDVILGVLCLRDERLRDAFGVDEIEIFQLLAAQIAITMENSRVYERMKERDRLAALGEMAAGLAHEIRNPLGAIKGAAQLLVGPDGTPVANSSHEVGEFLSIIIDETNRLNRVVSQFLDYARPYKGEPAEVDVNEVVRRTAQLFETQEAARGIAVELRLDDSLPKIRGDAEQLRQVFLNLGLNAMQAMGEGGKLAISTARRSGRRRIDAGASIEVRFRDTGPGIAREHMKNLFIPFFTTKEKGTGLGLPISQRIVTQHGGTIEVRSDLGQGATFTVLLPEESAGTSTGSVGRSVI